MNLYTKACLLGLGSYLPERILSNSELEKTVETSDEWIISRTGIKERRLAGPDEFPSDMGFAAAQEALGNSGKMAGDVDLVIVATMTPDYISPSTAALIQAKLGAFNAAAVDIQAACTGFLYGVSMAKAYIESGMYCCILLIATEKMSAFIDYEDRNTCVLFGDGAAAAVIGAENRGFAIDSVSLGAEGCFAGLMKIPAGGARMPASSQTVKDRLHYFKMVGNEVFKHAIRRMGQVAQESLKRAGIREEEVGWLVPHQANLRIIDALAKNLNISEEKVFKTLDRYGNTSASSVAIALKELNETQSLQAGSKLLLVAFGVGLTWGASILTKLD